MAKTRETDASVEDFIAGVEHPTRRADAEVLCRLMSDLSGEPPRMWGTNIVGFGHYDYVYATGRTGRWPRIGFSPRKASLSLYLMGGYQESAALLEVLGKHKVGKSCLYINKLADVDMEVLTQLIAEGLAVMSERYG